MRRKRHEEKEVDLAALVDILSNMLFFLLTTVSFLQLKTLNASVPALSTGPVSTGRAVDVTPPFPRVTVREAFRRPAAA